MCLGDMRYLSIYTDLSCYLFDVKSTFHDNRVHQMQGSSWLQDITCRRPSMKQKSRAHLGPAVFT
jgi:hypothetical protein